MAVPEAQSSVSDTAGPTKCLQVLLGTLRVYFSCSVMNWPINYEVVRGTALATPVCYLAGTVRYPPCTVSLVLFGTLQVSSVVSVTLQVKVQV